MKKCTRCGLLNDDAAEHCSACGFTAFAAKPAHAPRAHENPGLPHAGVTVERHGALVTLKCRTPAEACLVRDNLESAAVIALLPNEEEMLRQYQLKGFVEVEIPAAAYDSAGDLRSMAEFSVTPQPQGLPLHGKVLAVFLAIVIVPGLLVFAWLLSSYRAHGEERKAKDFKRWFFIGLAAWLLLILLSVAFSK